MSFERNLEIFTHFNPKVFLRFQNLDCKDVTFCKTRKGELNLCKKEGDKTLFFHSQTEALYEAQQQFKFLSLPPNCRLIIVYGIGLGYFYEAAKEWLNANPKHYLVFLEDDWRVVHRFLETERATKILSDPQVIIKAFDRPGENDWGKFRSDFYWFFTAFASGEYFHRLNIVIPLYNRTDYQFAYKLVGQLDMALGDFMQGQFEAIERLPEVSRNVYSNTLRLPESYYGPGLFGLFSKIPAIICGAGPSLAKQFEALKTLGDKALIFGAGSALNALNSNGVEPHFGGGLDPSDTQISRLASNFSYEMPFFYALRFTHGAYLKVHAPTLYVRDIFSLGFNKWLEKKLGFAPTDPIMPGATTTGMCLDIGRRLGCKPEIFVGVDLAYTSKTRYARGVETHPLDDQKHRMGIREKPEKTLKLKDSAGNDIQTLWPWILEEAHYFKYAHKYPEISFINATEGGLSIHDVPNLPLSEVIKTHLVHSYDLPNLIHAAIQNSSIPSLTSEKVIEVLKEWLNSMQKCHACCEQLIQELLKEKTVINETSQCPSSIFNPKALLLENELQEQDAYKYLMDNSLFQLKERLKPERHALEYRPELFTPQQKYVKEVDITVKLYTMLLEMIAVQLKIIDEVISTFLTSQNMLKNRFPQEIPNRGFKGDIYTFEDHFINIVDPEMGIEFKEHFYPPLVKKEEESSSESPHQFVGEKYFEQGGKLEGQYLFFYPSGELRGESFYYNGDLHGPSTFFTKEGKILARSWFIHGKRQGKTHQYYLSGELYSIQRFKEGLKQGIQEYYYRDGTLKTILRYNEGILEGEIILYHPNGAKKKECHFSQGKLEGVEKLWDADGRLILEAHYHQNQPTGTSRSWHPNGQLAKEMKYYDTPDQYDLYEWDEKGDLLKKQLYAQPPSEISKKAEDLKSALEKFKKTLDNLQG